MTEERVLGLFMLWNSLVIVALPLSYYTKQSRFVRSTALAILTQSGADEHARLWRLRLRLLACFAYAVSLSAIAAFAIGFCLDRIAAFHDAIVRLLLLISVALGACCLIENISIVAVVIWLFAFRLRALRDATTW